jgi:hypothetical protein
VSTLLHATVYMLLHNLLNVLVQIANKMGLQKKPSSSSHVKNGGAVTPLPDMST